MRRSKKKTEKEHGIASCLKTKTRTKTGLEVQKKDKGPRSKEKTKRNGEASTGLRKKKLERQV